MISRVFRISMISLQNISFDVVVRLVNPAEIDLCRGASIFTETVGV